MSVKKFCMLCAFFKPQNWCFGWCNKKEHYINKPLRYCAVGQNTEYALNADTWNLKHWKTAITWANIRYELLKEFYENLTKERFKE